MSLAHLTLATRDVRDAAAFFTATLGWRPIVSFEEGLKHTLDWCRAEAAATAGR